MSPRPVLLALLLGTALFEVSPAARAAANAEGAVPVAKVPSWVIPAERAPHAPSKDAAEQGGVIDETIDDQYRVASSVEHYMHRVKRIVSAAGVDEVGQMQIEFDPSYEHLTLHRVSIVRAGTSIDALTTATVRVTDVEREADQRVYNGRRTAHVLIHDLRVGDVVDYDYTLEGQNPVLGGRFVTVEPLATSRPVEYLRVRILAPPSRSLTFRTTGMTLDPVTRVADSMRELTWERRDVPEPVYERDVPSWYVQRPRLVVSEFDSWRSVAAWAVPLFEEAGRPTAEITAAANDIAQKHTTPAARALAALRFVQDEVRYLGIEMGANSHRPHPAADVLKQRFGDCKDKSVLLVALLTAMGIEAHGVLVDSDLREHVEGELPSPYAFDHAVVRILLEGKPIWVDPTRSAERSALGDAPLRFGKALVAARDTNGLSTIEAPFPKEPTVVTYESFRFGDTDGRLDVVRTFRDADARAMRHRLAGIPRAKIQKRYLDEYATMYPTIEVVEEMTVEDRPNEDAVVLREHYVMPHVVKDGDFSVRARGVTDIVGTTQSAKRNAPLGIDYPAFEHHQIDLYTDDGIKFPEPPDENFNDSVLIFTLRSETHDKRTVLDFEVRTLRDFVPPNEVAEHMALVDRIRDATYFSFTPSNKPRKGTSTPLTLLAAIGALFGIVGLVVVIRHGSISWLLRPRSRGHATEQPRQRRSGNGDTAATATWVLSRSEAEKLLLGPRCHCGARFTGPLPDSTWSAVLFDGRTITSARVVCAKCDKTRIRYFEIN
ncbi:DUF3857 domain-containing transglutaminase family protein [Pendulispora brunnea]|uniref:DUF3857 domain-containing transglutaminase family protein n=1 Tax=Pendulispora brunnea TaxID=2905690 RepID=A0ABZ2K8I6_9BACT